MQSIAERAHLASAIAENLPSPCSGICRLDALGRYCVGCLRSTAEIGGWGSYHDHEKKAVWQRLAWRAKQSEWKP